MQVKETNNLQWYKDAIIYEVNLRAFYDSNSDGIGDIKGLINKLDYLEDLGINTLWLLPFFPSPLRDDGYDVSDYMDVHPDYGTLKDFKKLLQEAHDRGIRIIIELVLNHTSDTHPWFQRSRMAPEGSKYRDYYIWSDDPQKFKDVRVIFSDFESSNWTWDPVAKAYYWHRFYRHQPDLNYDHPDVQKELLKIVDFWLKMGVDGFRVASAPFLFVREGSTGENLPETHAFLRKLRKHIDSNHPKAILLAEANMWPEDAAAYFGDGKECHMNFHYPLMPRLFMALHTEDSHPVVDIIEQTPSAPENSQWALFLRNHDELGLEMVTEEEKDYLYKAYGADPITKHNLGIRRRLAPLLNNDRRKIELLYTLLFSLPGSPIIYYGDEIGMGDNIYLGDRFGVRTPMQWNANINAGFSKANPQQLFLPVVTDPVYRHENVNVSVQTTNPSSILWWLKNLIGMRKRLRVFGRGSIRFIDSTNSKVLAFERTWEKQTIIVVTNLSKYSQATYLNLNHLKNSELTEVFSQNKFPRVGEKNYLITLGPYGYYGLSLDLPEIEPEESSKDLRLFKSEKTWDKVFTDYSERSQFEKQILPPFLKKCRWFGGKAKSISKVKIDTALPLKVESGLAHLLIVEVSYVQHLAELYFLPVIFLTGDHIIQGTDLTPQNVICKAELPRKKGYILDAMYDPAFRNFIFTAIRNKTRIKLDEGMLNFSKGVFHKFDGPVSKVHSEVLKADQSNTAVIYNDQYFFKIYRKIEKEINPDLELIRFLSEKTNFKNTPRFAGGFEFVSNNQSSMVFGLLQDKVDNQGEAWSMTMDAIGRYFDRVFSITSKEDKVPVMLKKEALLFHEAPVLIQELIGKVYYDRVVTLARRTAEMHLGLASDAIDPDFSPEPFTSNYQRSLYSTMRKLVLDRLKLLKTNMSKIPDSSRKLAEEILGMEDQILDFISEIYKKKITAFRTRIHGDYHLGQVLFNGKDFVIIDFEGEPGFTFSERRLKKSPYKDVAGMIRSFHYASYGKILVHEMYRDKDISYLESWAEQWQHYVSRFYLRAYLDRIGEDGPLSDSTRTLVRVYTLEKAIYELGYELNSRPDWVIIPLRGIHYIMKEHLKKKVHEQSK